MPDLKFSLPEVDSLDDVPEDFRSFYFEKDGKVQRQNPAAMASTMAKIRRENEKMAQELVERENRLSAYIEALGDDADPEIIKALKDKAARADQLPTNDEVEKRIRLVEENARKQMQGLQSEKTKLESIIETEAVSLQIREALKLADANQDGLDLLPQIMRTRVEKQYLDNGRIKLIPLDEDGTRMYADDGSEATLLDLANKFRETRPIFFNGSRASGLGTNGEAVSLPKNEKNWFKMSDAEKIDFQRKHPDKVAAMIAASMNA